MLEKELPREISAERAVLGTIILFSEYYDQVAAVLSTNDFTLDAHKAVWEAISDEIAAGGSPDLITLRSRLKTDSRVDFAYLSSLLDGIPDVSSLDRYAAIVKQASAQRAIMRSLALGLRDAESADPHRLAEAIIQELEEIATTSLDQDRLVGVDEIMMKVTAEIDRRHHEKDWITGIPSGLMALDAYTLGYQRKVLMVFGGYTSVGKTGIGLDLALRAVEANPNIRVAYFALEMSNEMLGYRLLSNKSSQPLHFVRSGNLSDHGLGKVMDASSLISTYGDRLMMSDQVFSVDKIAKLCRQEKRKRGLDLVFVDYLQLCDTDDEEYANNREREVNKIGYRLLQMAKRLDVAVVAFAQLNDGAVNRAGHRPMLSDMRESRAINQHARTVVLLHRPWLFDRENEELLECDAKLLIDKNSEGRTGEPAVHFNGSVMRWEDGECHPGCQFYGKRQLSTESERLLT
jgi:replicative DNA helicase